MNIKCGKIPLHMTNFPNFVEFVKSNEGEKFLIAMLNKIANLWDVKPSSSNVSFKVISDEMFTYVHGSLIWFEFYTSMNPFVGIT